METHADATVVTRYLPEVAAAFTKQDVEPLAFTGFDLGPFFIHQALSDNGHRAISEDWECWTVTHRDSGYAAQQGIPNLARAMWLARKLLDFNCWDGSTKDEVIAQVTPEIGAQINVLRADAKSGDCQGTFA